LDAIQRVLSAAASRRVALMCSEENPAVCHRHLLIARVLGRRKIDLLHIRGNGQIEKDSELRARENGVSGGFMQPTLFENPGADEWKSIRSVLPKKALGNSSRF